MREIFLVVGYTDDYEPQYWLVAAFGLRVQADDLVRSLALVHDQLRSARDRCADRHADDDAADQHCRERIIGRARRALARLGDTSDNAVDPDARWHIQAIPFHEAEGEARP